MKVYISSTEFGIMIDLEEASLWEWLKCIEEQFPMEEKA